MGDQEYKAPEEYRFPFPTAEDAYSYEDYREDCDHFGVLARTDAEPRKTALRYFRAHYPPADRAQRCLNLFWSIESFLTREIRRSGETPDEHGCVHRFERGTRAAWAYYSKCRYGDVITDDMAIVEITNCLIRDEEK